MATITIELQDSGPGTFPDVNTSPTQDFDITVTAVNDAPSFIKGANELVLEDAGAQTVAGWATAISQGPANESAQTVLFSVTANTNPTLFSTAPAISPTGELTYTPAADANGVATITVELQGLGRSLPTPDVNTSPTQDFTVTVTAVNDAPSFTKGANELVLEDAGAQTVAAWATAISQGPANESAQTVLFSVVANTNPTLFSTAPAISPTGELTYTPAADANGVATITVELQDSGPGTFPDVNTSPTQRLHHRRSLRSTMPPPSPRERTKLVLEDAGAQTVAGWATAISQGPANESAQTVSFSVTANTNPTLFSTAPAISPTGELTYTPAADANGVAAVTIELQDSGPGTAPDVNTSPTQDFDITVTAVNDAPVGVDDTASVPEDGAVTVDVLDNDTDVDGPTQTIGSFDAVSANGGAITLDDRGTPADPTDDRLIYTPAPAYHGVDTFSYVVSDGIATDTATVTITVGSVNDNPVWTSLPDRSDPEGTPLVVTFTASDVDGDPITYSATGLPPGLVLSATTGKVTGTPPYTATGSYPVTVTASDGVGGTAVLRPSPGPSPTSTRHPPLPMPPWWCWRTPPPPGPSRPPTPTATPSPTPWPPFLPHGVVTMVGASFTYTPAVGYAGPDSFVVVVSDGRGGTDTATVSVTVKDSNAAPVATPNAYTIGAGETLVVGAPGVLGNDFDPDGDPISAALVFLPARGTVSFNADGSFSYVPAGDGYTTTFTYTATDGIETAAPATVTIIVAPSQPGTPGDRRRLHHRRGDRSGCLCGTGQRLRPRRRQLLRSGTTPSPTRARCWRGPRVS